MTAKTLLDDELLACVLGGVYTDFEKTMIELQHTTIVKRTRSPFQTATRHKFIGTMERLSGREADVHLDRAAELRARSGPVILRGRELAGSMIGTHRPP